MYFLLPDLPRACPFSLSFSPHFESVAPESKAWIDSFGILLGNKRRYFSSSALELLAARVYPHADREGYRTGCDYLNVMFVLDDYSDDEGRKGARAMADSFINALRDVTCDDGTAFAKLAQELVDLISSLLILVTNDTLSSGSGKDLTPPALLLDNASSTHLATTSMRRSPKQRTESAVLSSVWRTSWSFDGVIAVWIPRSR